MQGVLKFNLPEEEDSFRAALDGWRYRSLLEDFDRYLRDVVKHGISLEGGESAAPYEKMRSKLWEMINEEGLEIP